MDSVERIITYLSNCLPSATVSQNVHSTRNVHDATWRVAVARVGGAVSRFLDEPRVTVDCYAGDSADAYSLATSVASWLDAMPDTDTKVSAVDVTSIYRNEWTDGQPCYSISAQMVVNV